MSLDALFEYAFPRGAGISRTSALKSPRFYELQEQMPRIPYLSAAETAEMTLLGEQIADRAFQNLPEPLRALAGTWSYLDEAAKVDLLNAFGKLQVQDDLQLLRRMLKNHPVSQVLPAIQGEFNDQGIRPNCLGMAQMLVGFARATGAPHLLVDILRRYDIYALQYQYRHLGELLEMLEPYGYDRSFNRFIRIIRKHRGRVLNQLAEIEAGNQAHHALAIRTQDNWWMVDPYFGVICPIDWPLQQVDAVYSGTQSAPRSAAVMHHVPSQHIIETRFRLRALKAHLPALSRLNETRSEWSFSSEGLRCVARTFMFYDTKDPAQSKEYHEKIGKVAAAAYFPQWRLDEIFKQEIVDLNEEYARAQSNKRFRNQAFRRLMLYLVRDCIIHIIGVLPGKSTPPILQELHHSTLQLAVKTVNHLGYRRNIPTPELIKYSRSQWIISDSLGMVERSGDKRLRQVAALSLRKYKKFPPYLLLNPQLHLSER